jgi:hypothetical protein
VRRAGRRVRAEGSGSQGERSSGRAGKDNAMTPKIALGRPMRSGLRMEEDSLLNSAGGRP